MDIEPAEAFAEGNLLFRGKFLIADGDDLMGVQGVQDGAERRVVARRRGVDSGDFGAERFGKRLNFTGHGETSHLKGRGR